MTELDACHRIPCGSKIVYNFGSIQFIKVTFAFLHPIVHDLSYCFYKVFPSNGHNRSFSSHLGNARSMDSSSPSLSILYPLTFTTTLSHSHTSNFPTVIPQPIVPCLSITSPWVSSALYNKGSLKDTGSSPFPPSWRY